MAVQTGPIPEHEGGFPQVPQYTAPVLPNGVLGNYWAGNEFMVPQQEAPRSAQFQAGGSAGLGLGTGGGGGLGNPYNPNTNVQLHQSQFGGTPATGGAFGSGVGFLNGTNGQVGAPFSPYMGGIEGVLAGYGPGLPPGLLGPSFNNLTDQEIREYLGQVAR